MSNAEDLAEKAYPQGDTYIFGDASIACQVAYVKGYHQAEKDLELTWEDIQLIVSIDWDLDHVGFSCGKSTEEYYKEVLKQFKEERNNNYDTN